MVILTYLAENKNKNLIPTSLLWVWWRKYSLGIFFYLCRPYINSYPKSSMASFSTLELIKARHVGPCRLSWRLHSQQFIFSALYTIPYTFQVWIGFSLVTFRDLALCKELSSVPEALKYDLLTESSKRASKEHISSLAGWTNWSYRLTNLTWIRLKNKGIRTNISKLESLHFRFWVL